MTIFQFFRLVAKFLLIYFIISVFFLSFTLYPLLSLSPVSHIFTPNMFWHLRLHVRPRPFLPSVPRGGPKRRRGLGMRCLCVVVPLSVLLHLISDPQSFELSDSSNEHMQLKFLVFILLSVLLTSTIARPQYKGNDFFTNHIFLFKYIFSDIDYKLYGDGDDGVAVDAVYEVISDKPPEGTPTKHHHHHHHKKMSKSNRLDRLRRYLNDRL